MGRKTDEASGPHVSKKVCEGGFQVLGQITQPQVPCVRASASPRSSGCPAPTWGRGRWNAVRREGGVVPSVSQS